MSRNTRALLSLVLVLSFAPAVTGQSGFEAPSFGPEKPVEREIAGGESHTYRVELTTGQFVRFRLDQKSLDCVLVLSLPDGRSLAEMDFTGTGELETLAIEATAGEYSLTVRGYPAATWRGAYRLDMTSQLPATASDRTYEAAQSLMLESVPLRKSGPDGPAQAKGKLEQALALWRELQEPSWTAVTLGAIGDVLYGTGPDKALEYYEQA
ncbi:MAG: hypothetical protein WBQ66_14495, partial [Blastocatellia bacterium]